MFTTLFAFGDSLSDAGNVYDQYGVPVFPYVGGHFSNGLSWVEDLSNMLFPGTTLMPSFGGGHDFAVGGAETGQTAIEAANNPFDLPSQITAFIDQQNPSQQVQGALFTLEIGTNDIIRALGEFRAHPIEAGTAIAQAEHNTVHAVETLYGLGARKLLFYEVPDLGLTPAFRAEGTAGQILASVVAQSFDQTVLSDLAKLELPGLKVYALPTFVDLDHVVNSSGFYYDKSPYNIAFGDVTNPWTSSGRPLSQADQYLFFDSLHPTALAHQLTADLAYQELTGHPFGLV